MEDEIKNYLSGIGCCARCISLFLGKSKLSEEEYDISPSIGISYPSLFLYLLCVHFFFFVNELSYL